MSIPIDSTISISEFQERFGGPPGSLDATTECKKWEKLCGEAIAERDRLREELGKVQSERDAYLKTVYYFMCKDYQPTFTKEELFANVGRQPSFGELIAEIEFTHI